MAMNTVPRFSLPASHHSTLTTFAAFGLAAGFLSLAGCATTGANGVDREVAQGLRTRGVDPAAVVVPWQLDPEMRAWAHQHVPDNLGAEERLTHLLSALLASDGLAL